MALRERKTLFDDDVGEVVRQSEQTLKRYWDEKKGYRWRDNTTSMRMFDDLDAPDTVSDADFRKLCRLRRHTWNDTQLLGRWHAGGVQAYNVLQIGRAVGLNERQAYRFVARMHKQRMIKRVKGTEVQYYLNPVYFCCCRWVSANLYLLFREEFNELLPQWVKERFLAINPEALPVHKRPRRKARRRIRG